MASSDPRKALAQAIGALNIVADVVSNPVEDNYLVRFMDGRTEKIDHEVARDIAETFEYLENALTRSGVRPAW